MRSLLRRPQQRPRVLSANAPGASTLQKGALEEADKWRRVCEGYEAKLSLQRGVAADKSEGITAGSHTGESASLGGSVSTSEGAPEARASGEATTVSSVAASAAAAGTRTAPEATIALAGAPSE